MLKDGWFVAVLTSTQPAETVNVRFSLPHFLPCERGRETHVEPSSSAALNTESMIETER